MKLTKDDVTVLKNAGYEENDMRIIEEASTKTKYSLDEKTISRKTAEQMIGRAEFILSLARSTFHWSACRPVKDTGKFVYFDSSAYCQ